MNFNYDQHFKACIKNIQNEGRYRYFKTIERLVGRFPKALYHYPDGSTKEITVWCSNDYLGMGQHPTVLSAAQEAIQKSGTSAGGTRNISGTTKYHVDLEHSIADLHHKEAGLIFSSGYAANEATLSTLGKLMPDCAIFSDEFNHASMIHGINSSKCQKFIFRHNDVAHLEYLLKSVDTHRPKLIAFESVYSMEGDVSPIPEIIELAKKYNAMTYLDEVHGVGLYGPRGGGIAEALDVLDDIDILEGTFGKGYGVVGGFITGDHPVVDAVRSFASTFIFTTSLPPSVLAAAHASVEHLKVSNKERIRLHQNVDLLKSMLRDAGLKFYDGETHILPLIVGEATCCRHLTDVLLEAYDIYVQPINYPTVPRGKERLRITASATHSEEEVRFLANTLEELWIHNHVAAHTSVA